MCVDMCMMNLHVHGCVYVFSCFTCYLGLKMTASFCWYPVLRFNGEYWLYLQSLSFWGWCAVIRLGILHNILTGFFGLIYLCIYVLLRDTTLPCNPLDLYFWREINLSRNFYFLFICLSFNLEAACSHHVINFWY